MNRLMDKWTAGRMDIEQLIVIMYNTYYEGVLLFFIIFLAI